MKHVLQKHQRQALRYATTRQRIALFMEMRLGKSPVAIRWAKRRQAKRVLLVAPLNTLSGSLNWYGELQRESIEPTMLASLPKEKRWAAIRRSQLVAQELEMGEEGHVQPQWFLRQFWGRGWYTVNYDALRTQPELLAAPWDAIILDESTRIRSPRALVTKVLEKHTAHIPLRAILTGLPNPESPLDYFCQFKFRDGQFMGFTNYYKFRHALFFPGFGGWGWMPKRKTRDRIKAYVHANAFVLTRKAAKVGSQKIRQQRTVELNGAQRRAIKELKETFALDGVETKWVTTIHLWQQRIAGGFHPITKELISDRKPKLAEELLMEQFRHEPVVIWFRFNEEMEWLSRWLRKRHRKLTTAFIHGKVDRAERPKIQERFQRGDVQVLLMQVKIRFGWNLSHSSTAIYYSNSYEFEDRSQSEDRIIHLTKQQPCLYLDLVTRDTPDEDVVDALTNKRMTARQFNSRVQAAALARL